MAAKPTESNEPNQLGLPGQPNEATVTAASASPGTTPRAVYQPKGPAPSAPQPGFFARWWRTAIMVGVPAVAVAACVWLMQARPAFYDTVLGNISLDDRRALSRQFLNKGTRLIADIQNNEAWSASFAEDQINSWLAVDFEENHADQSLPTQVSRPRIALQGDKVQLGFEYQLGPIETVIQANLRFWVPQQNVIVVEIEGAWAGNLPLTAGNVQKVIEKVAQSHDLEVSWRRNGNALVAVLEFPRSQRAIVLTQIQVREKEIRLKGISRQGPYVQQDWAPSAN